MNNIDNTKIACRLCSSASEYIFSKEILSKYTVRYFECFGCKSLQSEYPYWLAESYAPHSLVPDFSTLRRVVHTQKIIFWISKIFKFEDNHKLLDWGGGNGLLVRLLRDVDIDSYLLDEYVKNLYAISFEHLPSNNYRMITAIQVWEHFSDPAEEMVKMFSMNPDFVLVSTGLYNSQGPDWQYLNAYGRHVFCYSLEGRKKIAEKFGYTCIGQGDLTLFCRSAPSYLERMLLRFATSGRFRALSTIIYDLWPSSTKLIEADRSAAFKKIYIENKPGEANWP